MAYKTPQDPEDHLASFLPDGRSLGDLPTELLEDQKNLLFETHHLIAGRFEIVEELGFGGMGAVYKVIDHLMDEQVKSLKFILPSLVSSQGARKRFIQEAKIAQSLRHDGIATVYDIGQDGDLLFLTMEYLEGQNLAQYLKSKGSKLGFSESCTILLQVCEALSYAHKRGVIHRDIKPQNIFVLPDGQAKLLDFGLAKLISPGRLARSSMGLGTAYYMSPEQSLGKEVDARSDIFALGVVFYQMLVGQVPMGMFELPSAIDDNLPKTLDQLFGKCLSQLSEKRFGDTETVAGEIRNIRDSFVRELEREEEEKRIQNTEHRRQEEEEERKRQEEERRVAEERRREEEEKKQKIEYRRQNTEYRTQNTGHRRQKKKSGKGGFLTGRF